MTIPLSINYLVHQIPAIQIDRMVDRLMGRKWDGA